MGRYNIIMDNNAELLKKRFAELAHRADGRGCLLYSGFLSLGEQAVLASVERTLSAPYALYGGAEGCERRMARFGYADADDAGGYPIAVIEIAPKGERFAPELTHRDYLGALMHTGVERERIGDIVVRGKRGYAFVEASLAPYFADTLEAVGRTGVVCRICADVPEGELFRTEDGIVRVSSLRLDALAAQAFHISRGDAAELFTAERVFVNGALAKAPSAAPKEGDIISVRGFGRFIFSAVSGQSKKGKLVVEIKRYV